MVKIQYYLLAFTLFACEKKEDKKVEKQTEESCFETAGINYDKKKAVPPVPTAAEILKNLPKHIAYTENSAKKTTLPVAENYQDELKKEKEYFASNAYKTKFQSWIKELGEFNYVAEQTVGNTQYALAKNKYGLWLVEKAQNQKAKPYFLGLTHNVYTEINNDFIDGKNILLHGQILSVERFSRFPIVPKYTLVKGNLDFKININDIKKDSDNDGFNDLFEDFIGLNPKSKDTDNDGMDDFSDSNPRFASQDSKFTKMYEKIADIQAPKTQYSFTEVLTNCNYFYQINPKNQKFLFYKTDEHFQLEDDVLDLYFPIKYGKIKRPTLKQEHETYFIEYGDAEGAGSIAAEYINGKWRVTRQFNLIFSV